MAYQKLLLPSHTRAQRPRTQKTLGLLDALSPLTPLQDDRTPTAAGSLVNVGSGIPDDESGHRRTCRRKIQPY